MGGVLPFRLLPPVLRWSLLIVCPQTINFVPARREKWRLEPGLSSPQAPTADSTKEGGKMGVCVCVCVCVCDMGVCVCVCVMGVCVCVCVCV